MKPLDPHTLDLNRTTLIEASAGTGKTYTITTLLVRLLAQGFPIESILVVTFTEAAAAELKLRIRGRLSLCLAGLTREAGRDADPLTAFLKNLPDPGLVVRRLSHALTCFDQACIMTIHSFCLSVLREHAFETRTPFDLELVPDRSLFLDQVCRDFFLSRINDLDPLMLRFLAREGVTPDSMAARFRPVVSRTGLAVRPENAGFREIFREYRGTTARIQSILETDADAVAHVIRSHKGLDKRSYSKKNVPAWLEAARRQIAAGPAPLLFDMTEKGDSLYKFTRTRLGAKTKNGEPPVHDLFDRCEDLLDFQAVLKENRIRLETDFLHFFKTELAGLKHHFGQYFFDDLVNDLAFALEGENGPVLKQAVRDTFKACLIDEFQDTDPAQYTIFSLLFHEPGTPFFMIGDPKQAIYAFRGGDIFAYLTACKDARQMFTLDKNYRSSPSLVHGINDLLSRVADPFMFRQIEFTPVGWPPTAQDRLKRPDSTPAPALVFDVVLRDALPMDRQGCITKETAGHLIPGLVARNIVADLGRGLGLSDGKGAVVPLSPGHMAVLVRTNRQALAVQQALSHLNVPSYVSGTGSVWDSSEAEALYGILWAVFRPENPQFVRAALLTPVFGLVPDDLGAMDPEQGSHWQDWFRELKDTWESRGFVAMATALLHSEKSLLKAGAQMGERGLTNFFHLVELVSRAALDQRLSMAYLVKWYEAQLTQATRDQAADELRLESDKKAVAIVTIHKSKGLEYPVVYLPYLWAGAASPKGPVLFHDPDNGHRLTLDLRRPGDPALNQALAQQNFETRAEERRLLYVALTRASARCRIIWGGISGAGTSALGCLLHPQGLNSDDALLADLEKLAATGPHRTKIRPVDLEAPAAAYQPDPEDPVSLAPRPLTRTVSPGYRLTSFTAMTASAAGDHSLGPAPRPVPGEHDCAPANRIGVLDPFPKGADTGNFFHGLLEHLDFTANEAAIARQVEEQMKRFGFEDPQLAKAAKTGVEQILCAGLTPLGTDQKGFCLKDIPKGDRLNEMEFLMKTGPVDMNRLADLFEKESGRKTYGKVLRSLDSVSVKGFVKGFVDLVIRFEDKFYVVDYKSNFLGETYGHYNAPAMDRAMTDHHYILQYHLYVLALIRYLKLRMTGFDAKLHFGGVFYLFIRGMHPDIPGAGVFFDRPENHFLEALDALF